MTCCCPPIVGSGSSAPPVPPSGGPLLAVRFSELPDQVLANGANVIDGVTWEVIGLLAGDSLAIVNGVGLVFVAGPLGRSTFATTQTVIQVPRANLPALKATAPVHLRVHFSSITLSQNFSLLAIGCFEPGSVNYCAGGTEYNGGALDMTVQFVDNSATTTLLYRAGQGWADDVYTCTTIPLTTIAISSAVWAGAFGAAQYRGGINAWASGGSDPGPGGDLDWSAVGDGIQWSSFGGNVAGDGYIADEFEIWQI